MLRVPLSTLNRRNQHVHEISTGQTTGNAATRQAQRHQSLTPGRDRPTRQRRLSQNLPLDQARGGSTTLNSPGIGHSNRPGHTGDLSRPEVGAFDHLPRGNRRLDHQHLDPVTLRVEQRHQPRHNQHDEEDRGRPLATTARGTALNPAQTRPGIKPITLRWRHASTLPLDSVRRDRQLVTTVWRCRTSIEVVSPAGAETEPKSPPATKQAPAHVHVTL